MKNLLVFFNTAFPYLQIISAFYPALCYLIIRVNPVRNNSKCTTCKQIKSLFHSSPPLCRLGLTHLFSQVQEKRFQLPQFLVNITISLLTYKSRQVHWVNLPSHVYTSMQTIIYHLASVKFISNFNFYLSNIINTCTNSMNPF